MPWPVTNTTRIHCTGDSITSLLTGLLGNWPGNPGGFTDQLRARPVLYMPSVARTLIPGRLGQTIPSSYTPVLSTGRRQVVTVYGVGGRVIAGLQTDLPASVYAYAPDLLIIELGTNDFGGGTDVTPGGAFQTSYNAVLDGVHSTFPNCKILCLSTPIRSEQWTAGNPPHLSDNLDTWAGNTRIQESVNARSTFCEYVDILTPAFAFVRANQAAPGVSPFLLTQDSLHPTPLGKVLIGTTVMQHLVVS